jgi:hypothetical protein
VAGGGEGGGRAKGVRQGWRGEEQIRQSKAGGAASEFRPQARGPAVAGLLHLNTVELLCDETPSRKESAIKADHDAAAASLRRRAPSRACSASCGRIHAGLAAGEKPMDGGAGGLGRE